MPPFQFTPSPIPGETPEVERPIYLLSHKLSRTQCRYSTIEKEAFDKKSATTFFVPEMYSMVQLEAEMFKAQS
jgi:hypothetical protein